MAAHKEQIKLRIEMLEHKIQVAKEQIKNLKEELKGYWKNNTESIASKSHLERTAFGKDTFVLLLKADKKQGKLYPKTDGREYYQEKPKDDDIELWTYPK